MAEMVAASELASGYVVHVGDCALTRDLWEDDYVVEVAAGSTRAHSVDEALAVCRARR